MPHRTIRRSTTVVLVSVSCVVVTLAMLWSRSSDLSTAMAAFDVVDWRYMGCGLALSTAAIVNRGLMNRVAHRTVGLRLSRAESVGTASAGFAAQKLFKSGGLSGLAVFVHHGRRKGYGASAVTGACALMSAASFVALGVAVAGTIVTLAVIGRLTGWWIAAAIGFGVYGAVVAALVVAACRHRDGVLRCWFTVHAWSCRLRRGRPRSAPDSSGLDDLFAALGGVRNHPRDLCRIAAHAIAGKAAGAAMLLVAAHGVGVTLSATDALIIYASALGASLISIVPAGFGVVEASTVALLVSGGAATTAAVGAVALFRVYDLWLPVIAGLGAARGQLRAKGHEDVIPEPVESARKLAPAA